MFQFVYICKVSDEAAKVVKRDANVLVGKSKILVSDDNFLKARTMHMVINY